MYAEKEVVLGGIKQVIALEGPDVATLAKTGEYIKATKKFIHHRDNNMKETDYENP